MVAGLDARRDGQESENRWFCNEAGPVIRRNSGAFRLRYVKCFWLPSKLPARRSRTSRGAGSGARLAIQNFQDTTTIFLDLFHGFVSRFLQYFHIFLHKPFFNIPVLFVFVFFSVFKKFVYFDSLSKNTSILFCVTRLFRCACFKSLCSALFWDNKSLCSALLVNIL